MSYGLFWGLLMTSDRLIRCNPGARNLYTTVLTEHGSRLYDPPRANFMPDPDRSPDRPARRESKGMSSSGAPRLDEMIDAVVPKAAPFRDRLEDAAGDERRLLMCAESSGPV